MHLNLQGSRFFANNTNNMFKNIVTRQLQLNDQREQNEQNKVLALLDVTSGSSCDEMSSKKTWNPYFNGIRLLDDGHLPDNATTYEVKIGGAYEYSEEDAYNRLNTPSLKMDDTFLEQMELDPSHRVVDDTSIENGLSANRDYYWANLDCGTAALNSKQLEQSVDYLASRYAVMKDRIDNEYTSEERIVQLDNLDQMMNKHKEKLAQNFADEVGTIFEENGVTGEKDRLYQSVLAIINQQTEQYTNFIKLNQDFAKVNNKDKAWLSKDSAYLASALRKAFHSADTTQRKESAASGQYTLDEMKKIQTFSKEFSSYENPSFDLKGRTEKAVSLSDNEESLGMKLAELTLKGKIFNEQADISDHMQQTVVTAISNFTEKAIDNLQAYFNKFSELQIASTEQLRNKGEYTQKEADQEITNIKKYFSPVDKNAVYAVINKVEDIYEHTGNVTKAMIDGAVTARSAFYSKIQDEVYVGIGRYDHEAVYWNSFFENKDTYYGGTSYILKESVFNDMMHSWNSFMGAVTSDESVLINISQFSGWA